MSRWGRRRALGTSASHITLRVTRQPAGILPGLKRTQQDGPQPVIKFLLKSGCSPAYLENRGVPERAQALASR